MFGISVMAGHKFIVAIIVVLILGLGIMALAGAPIFGALQPSTVSAQVEGEEELDDCDGEDSPDSADSPDSGESPESADSPDSGDSPNSSDCPE